MTSTSCRPASLRSGSARSRAGTPGADTSLDELAIEEATMEADRQRPVSQQRVVKLLQRERIAEPSPLVVAKTEDQHLPEQVAELVAGRVRVALDLGSRVRRLEGGVLDEEGDGFVYPDLTAVHPDVEDDPARPPDGVGRDVEPEVRRVVEALLAHHLLGVHPPALDELRGVGL